MMKKKEKLDKATMSYSLRATKVYVIITYYLQPRIERPNPSSFLSFLRFVKRGHYSLFVAMQFSNLSPHRVNAK